jgi:signal transduction histidine kinase
VAAVVELLREDPQDPWRAAPVLGTTVPVAWRRHYPIAAFLVQSVASGLTTRPPVGPTLVAQFIGVYSIALYSRWRLSWLIPVAGAAVLAAVGIPLHFAVELPAWGFMLVAGLGVWLAGNTVRRIERERELATHVALAAERARIARELHDVVAHSVSVMVVQAGAARRLLGRQPDRATEALLAVEGGGREALSELRRLLGLLTEEGSEPSRDPEPGLGQLDRLVDRVTTAGLQVDVRIEGVPRPLTPGLDLTAYRILQEALTNTLKHAPGSRTRVAIQFLEHELQLEVVDSGGSPAPNAVGAGRGLIGMRERVTVYGGELETGHRPDGGFAVRARLPLQPA